jgi:hypothetical protein
MDAHDRFTTASLAYFQRCKTVTTFATLHQLMDRCHIFETTGERGNG